MKVINNYKKIQNICRENKLKGKSIGFVPTMGALHQGHLSLIKQARRENDLVIVSIFVNPIQFGPKEDFKRYPRSMEKDISLCEKEEVDFIFFPDVDQMYSEGFTTYVTVEGLTNVLCGKSRPDHFKGVATVVNKLFNIVIPDRAYFGQKDAQQTVIIKRMVYDLNIPVKIRIMPIVREKSGLALSSRNIYLNEQEKTDAPVLFHSLNLANVLIKKGITRTDEIINIMKQLIQKRPASKIDYIEVVDANSLQPVKKITGSCLIALAVWIGRTRLIDNMIVKSNIKNQMSK